MNKLNRTKILLAVAIIGAVGLLSNCNSTPEPPRPTVPRYDYQTESPDGQPGIWIQPMQYEGQPRPDMIFHRHPVE